MVEPQGDTQGYAPSVGGQWPGFWAKLRHDPEGRLVAWHPLRAHAADVAAVFQALLAIPDICIRLEAAAGGTLCPVQTQRLAVLAALHDLGKLNQGFQRKCDPRGRPTCGHVAPLAGLFSRAHAPRTRYLLREVFGWFPPRELMTLLNAVFSHHGSPVAPWDKALHVLEQEGGWWRTEAGRDPFQALAGLLADCRRWFPEAFTAQAEALPSAALFSHLFAGLVSLADWLGSDERWFPFCGQDGRPGPGEDPMPFARQAAARAVASVGLEPTPASRLGGVPPTFAAQFGFPRPHPAQQAVMDLPLVAQGDLVILEAETGSGKTEAAWLHFMRLYCAGLVDGLYFANPLRLAATQIHQRLSGYARGSFAQAAPPVVLAVPGYLKVDGQEGTRLPGYQVLWPDQGEPEVATRRWASETPKRYLCAPIAAGTIDQALMAGLRLPHAPLRAAAICRSLLVVDEVHASDTYMTALLTHLMGLFRRAQGQVLMMSATLGGETRQRLLDAWRSGRPGPAPHLSLRAAEAEPYPLISRPAGFHTVSLGDTSTDKLVAPRLYPWLTEPKQVATLAAQLARQGGVVLVLRNTVSQAVATAQALEALLADQPHLLFQVRGVPTLHHGRFAAQDRRLLDQALLGLYGKREGPARRRPAGVVVATQTLEQSLDVDFDVLITDLCPLDVLLQRIGRLHRHPERVLRAAEFQRAVCHLLVPSQGEAWLRGREAHGYGFGVDGRGQARAYADPRALVAAWRLLADYQDQGRELAIPSQNRRLVEQSLHSQVLESLAQELGPEWEANARRLQGLLLHQRQLAQGHGIDWAKPYGPDSAAVMPGEAVQTRLGIADLCLEPPAGLPGPFGREPGALKMPAWLARGAAGQEMRDIQPLPGGGFGFGLGEGEFIYDRFGLAKRGDEDAI